MGYFVKEIYYTIQSEGAHSGRPAVFCRFTGCNLWTGRESDRSNAICQFCDTDFLGTNGFGGGVFSTAAELAEAIDSCWSSVRQDRKFVVCTGGEPLLQLDKDLIDQLHKLGFMVAVETNGTVIPPSGIDWICVSPKSKTVMKLKHGNEIKVVYPQEGIDIKELENLEFDRFFLQPMDGPNKDENTTLTIRACLGNPRWELSLQINKLVNMR